MKHSEEWHARLAKRLGHPGWLTLAEIRKAEREEAVVAETEHRFVVPQRTAGSKPAR